MSPESPRRFVHRGASGNDRFGVLAERDKLRDAATREDHDGDIRREREFEARQTEVLRRERALAEQHLTLLEQNTRVTEEIVRLTAELHATICHPPNMAPSTGS